MIKLLRRLHNDTEDNNNRMHYIMLKLSCMLIAAFLLMGLTGTTAWAESGLKIYDYSTKKTTTYTGKQVGATCNGTKISTSTFPGIIVEGAALLPYDDIFEDSRISADCVYNKKKGTISITKYDTTIIMKIGSKKATVNGKSVTMSIAPKKIKYVNADTTKILVPSRFVSETLGLSYSWYSSTNTVAITKNTILLSYNNGEAFEYIGTQGKVTIDGNKVELGSMPSIIVNNTAMLRAKTVFSGSEIGASYSYNKADKTITLTKDSNKLVMTLGSKTAYLNDQKMSMDTAPVMVSNIETGYSYVMVPGSFTASCLGYNYKWNKSLLTSVITTPKTTQGDPELGDSGDMSETGTILNQWNGLDSKYGVSSGVHDLNNNVYSDTTNGSIYLVTRDTTNSKDNSETYMITATEAFGKISASNSGKLVTIQANGVSCVDQIYQTYGTTGNLVNTIQTYNSGTTGTIVNLTILAENYQYDISLSADQKTLYVTVYNNAITSAIVGTNSNGDYLKLSGILPFESKISESNGFLYIDLPNTVNVLGDISTEIQGSKYIKQILMIKMQDKTQLILTLNDGYQYYSKSSGNQFTIMFQPKNAGSNQPTSENDTNYEITIPKPAGITSAMISDKDFYFNNYFVITLLGDYTSIINSNSITKNSTVVSKISVSLNASGNTEIKVHTSKLQGYKITTDTNNIYVNVGNPRDIYKNIVVLDPGHGGSATGAQKNGYDEKDINLKILYTLGEKYFNLDTSMLKVYFTRTADTTMSLQDRAAYAEKVGADLFVSLHMNAAPQANKAKGTEAFYAMENNSANDAGLTSKEFAACFVDNITDAIGTSYRGVKEAGFVVIKENTVPAVLIELGFLTNSTDFSIITDEASQELAAESIYETLLEVFNDYPTGR